MTRALASVFALLWAALPTVTVRAQAESDAKPLRVTDLGDGTVFVWSYAKLQACGPDRTCTALALPQRHVRDVRAACVGRAFVLAEDTKDTDQGTEFYKTMYLLDPRGKVLDSWDMADGVLDFAVKDGRAYVLTGHDRVVKLEPHGKRAAVMNAHPRDQRVFVDKQGRVVLCRPSVMSEAIHAGEDRRASCSSQAGWSFQGHWFHVEPIACGDWLIEPAMKGTAGTKTQLVQLRTLETGQVVSSARLGVEELRCLDGAVLYDLLGQRTISLPAMKTSKPMTCGQVSIRDVAENQTRQTCLSTRGQVATLQVRAGKARP